MNFMSFCIRPKATDAAGADKPKPAVASTGLEAMLKSAFQNKFAALRFVLGWIIEQIYLSFCGSAWHKWTGATAGMECRWQSPAG